MKLAFVALASVLLGTLLGCEKSAATNNLLPLLGGGVAWEASVGNGAGISPAVAPTSATQYDGGVVLPEAVRAETGLKSAGYLGCYAPLDFPLMLRDRISLCISDSPQYGRGMSFLPLYPGLAGEAGAIAQCTGGQNAAHFLLSAPSATLDWILDRCYRSAPQQPVAPPQAVALPQPITPPPAVAPPVAVTPPQAVTPPPVADPEEPTAPFQAYGLRGITDSDGNILPEHQSGYTVGFDRRIQRVRPMQSQDWVQLWAKQSNGTWQHVPGTSWTSGDNWVAVSVTPGPSWTGLNKVYLEPETTYRALIWAGIRSETGEKLGVFNTLGAISANPSEWSGIEFRTAKAPCYASYWDRYKQPSAACHYSLANYLGRTEKDFGCMMRTNLDHADEQPPAGFCDLSAFPEVRLKPIETSLFPAAGCPMREPIYLKSGLPGGTSGVCIQNAGEPEERVRVYYMDMDSKPADCVGLVRLHAPGTPGGLYALEPMSYRRAACEGGAGQAPPPTPQDCTLRVSMAPDGSRWYLTPEEKIPNPKRPGRTISVSGMHTFWENEPLRVTVTGVCQAGHHELAVSAKNISGPRPEWYGAFHLNIAHVGRGENYGLSIKAADDRYVTVRTPVWLEKGKNELVLNWSNDAYKSGEYDANIQIRSVSVSPSRNTPTPRTSFKGSGFCHTEGRFFGAGQSIFADRVGQTAVYCLRGAEPGRYRIVISGKNQGSTPAGFPSFQVRVRVDGSEAGYVEIPTEGARYGTGRVEADIFGGNERVDVTWINAPPQTDSAPRFELKAVRLVRLGEPSGTRLAGYLRSVGSTRSFWIAMLALGACLLGFLFMGVIRTIRR